MSRLDANEAGLDASTLADQESPSSATRGPQPANRYPIPQLALCLAMLILAGHLQFAFYGILATLIFAVSTLNFKSVFKTGIALAVAALLSAPHWGPVMAMGQISHRRAPATAEGYAAYQASAIQPWEWFGLMDPQAMGSMNTFAPPPLETISTYWPALVKLGSNPAESAVAIGPVILIGILGLRWRDRRRWAGLAVLGVLAMLLASTPLNAALYNGVPGFSATGSPGRIVVLFVLAACALAGLGMRQVDADSSGIDPLAKRNVIVALCAIATGAVGAYTMQGLLPSWNPGVSREMLRAYMGAGTSAFCNLALLMGAAIYGATLVLKNYSRLQTPVALLTILILGIPMAVRTGKPITIADRDPLERRVSIVPRWELLMQFPGTVAPPNLNVLIYGHAQVSGYDSLLAKSSVEMLKGANRGEPAPPTNGNMMLATSWEGLPGYAELGATDHNGGRPTHVPMSGPGVLDIDASRITNTLSKSDSRVRFEASTAGTATYRQANLGGWKATVNGKPVSVGFGHWPEIANVQKGDVVEFRYEPDLKWPLCIAGALLLAGIWSFGLVSSHLGRQSAKPSSTISPNPN